MRYHMLTTRIIRRSGEKARQLGHSFVGSVHLLLAMAEENGNTGNLLRLFGVNPEVSTDIAVMMYGKGDGSLALPQGLTGNARGILRGAAEEAERMKSREIGPMHLLLALSRRQEMTHAGQLLVLQGVDPGDLFSHGVQMMQWVLPPVIASRICASV